MGKYTAKFLEALSVDYKSKYSQVNLIFNKNLDAPDRTILNLFKSKAIFLNLPVNISEAYDKKKKEAKKTITDYINQEKGPREYLITAPFFVDFFAEFPEGKILKSVIAYDIIPYKVWHVQRIFPDDLYAQHFELYVEADKILTISESVKLDLINLLGAREEKVFSINGGPFTSPKANVTRRTTKLKNPFILMPSAPIVHKNNERAVAAFDKFNRKNDNMYTLYITSTFDEKTKASLKKQSPKVEFTENISDEELLRAYENAEAVLFASLSEGLGMPVLEAISCGVPVACSNIHVLAEISEKAMYLFDPTNVSSITNSLEQAVHKEDWQANNKEREKVLEKYTWQRVAEAFIGAEIKSTQKTKVTLTVRCDNPNQGTISGNLIESYCLALGENFVINLDTKDLLPTKPSISSYLFPIQKKGRGNLLIVRQKLTDRILGRKRVQLCLKQEDNARKSVILECKNTVYDHGLRIKKSTYLLAGKEFKAQNLVKWIEQETTRQ